MVSIITTFFNAERFLDANIRSVQSIQPQNKIEHILVNDGSNDQSLKIASSYTSNNVSVISPGRIGRAKALNLAVRKSKYRYICILDADDMINPFWVSNFIENSNELINFDRKTIVFFGKTKIVDAQSKNGLNDEIKFSSLHFKKYSNHEIFFHNPVPHLGTIIDKDFFRESNIYSEERQTQLDWDLWFRIIKSDKKFLKIDCISGYKRIHIDQYFERKTRIKYLFSGIYLQLYYAYKIRKLILPLVFIAAILRSIWRLIPQKYRMTFHNKIH